jgi:hypothetical protein
VRVWANRPRGAPTLAQSAIWQPSRVASHRWLSRPISGWVRYYYLVKQGTGWGGRAGPARAAHLEVASLHLNLSARGADDRRPSPIHAVSGFGYRRPLRGRLGGLASAGEAYVEEDAGAGGGHLLRRQGLAVGFVCLGTASIVDRDVIFRCCG